MGILLLILCMVLFFKFIGFLFRITGKIIGGIFSLLGFAIIGVICELPEKSPLRQSVKNFF